MSAVTKEDVLDLLQEISQAIRDLVRSGQETDRRMQETDRRMQETDRLTQETRLLQQETARQMRETDRHMQVTDRKLKEMGLAVGRLGNRLGEFVEEMVRPAVVRLFRTRGIDVHQVFPRAYAERDGYSMEIDLLVVNDGEAVLVETKSELKVDDVNEHVERLAHFKAVFPQYRGYRVMGAVAAMVIPDSAAKYAYREGLFVLGQSGDSVDIRNGADFRPKTW